MPFLSFRLLSGTWLWELELYCWECRWGTSGGDKDLWKGASSDDENTDDTADEKTDGTDDIDDENTGALQVAINVYEMGEWCDENPASLFSRSGTWGLIWTRKTEEGHTDILQTFEHCSINAGTQTFLLSKDATHATLNLSWFAYKATNLHICHSLGYVLLEPFLPLHMKLCRSSNCKLWIST